MRMPSNFNQLMRFLLDFRRKYFQYDAYLFRGRSDFGEFSLEGGPRTRTWSPDPPKPIGLYDTNWTS